MVFKVSKGGVRTGNTLRGLHSTRTKRYGHQACLLGCTNLGRRDLSRLVQDDSEDEEWVKNTLVKTDVLLSLNKQQRWRLPAIVGQMIRNGRFHKGATVSMLEKHKLKRKANCVSLVSNSDKASSIVPKQKKYFSYSLEAAADDMSKREKRRERSKMLKKDLAPKEISKKKNKASYSTVTMFTSDGISTEKSNTNNTPATLHNDKPEYRLEVFYPCPKSCSLTYNPKYTDVVVAEGKTGKMEVMSNVKSQKKGFSTNRKRMTLRDVESQLCEGYQHDVDGMWEEAYDDFESGKNQNDIMFERAESRSVEHSLAVLLAQAQKTMDICIGKKENMGNKHKKLQNASPYCSNNKQDKSHIVYVDRESPKDEKTFPHHKTDINKSMTDEAVAAPGLAYFRVILSTSEVTPEELKRRYGPLYTEAPCHPRRFVLDVTDDMSNLLAMSKSATRQFDYTSFMVFTYDGFYDEGLVAYRVAFNSMMRNDMKGLCEIVLFSHQSITDIMNTVVCHLLDLKEQRQLEILEMKPCKKKNDDDDNDNVDDDLDFLRSRIKLSVEVFDPSDHNMPRNAITAVDHGDIDKEGIETIDDHQWHVEFYDELDEDSFCDVCYATLTSSKTDSACGTRLSSCDHFLCDDCWTSHFRTSIKQGKTEMSCAGYDCDSTVGLVTLLSILNLSEIALTLQRQAGERIETMENAKWCPHPGCGRAIVVDSKLKDMCVDVICACRNEFCFSCLGQPHWPAKCDQAGEYLDKLPTICNGWDRNVTS